MLTGKNARQFHSHVHPRPVGGYALGPGKRDRQSRAPFQRSRAYHSQRGAFSGGSRGIAVRFGYRDKRSRKSPAKMKGACLVASFPFLPARPTRDKIPLSGFYP